MDAHQDRAALVITPKGLATQCAATENTVRWEIWGVWALRIVIPGRGMMKLHTARIVS